MTEQIKQIAERIKELREIAGISEETIAKNTGISAKQFLEFENGKSRYSIKRSVQNCPSSES